MSNSAVTPDAKERWGGFHWSVSGVVRREVDKPAVMVYHAGMAVGERDITTVKIDKVVAARLRDAKAYPSEPMGSIIVRALDCLERERRSVGEGAGTASQVQQRPELRQ